MSANAATKQQPFMPLFFGDLLASTSEWEGIERSLYISLLAYQWFLGSLPCDVRKLAKLVDWERELFETCWRQVSQKFQQQDGRLYNPRLEQHRARAREISAKNAASGKKGAAAKWRKDGERHAESVASATEKNGERHANHLTDANSGDGERQANAMISPMAPGYGNPNQSNPTQSIDPEDSHPSGARPTRERPGHDLDRELLREAFLMAKACYPAHTHGDSPWIQAERDFYWLVENGVASAAELVEKTVAYRDQQQAMGNIGTQFVKSPATFYDRQKRAWYGPFPKPATKAKGASDLVAKDYGSSGAI